jgi:hypothetical protein
MVCEEELSDPRHQGHGPERVPSFGHQFGDLHEKIVDSVAPDDTFYSKISNREKVQYICGVTRMAPKAFHLDLPLPLEDWAHTDDVSLVNCGLYFSDMRRQFYDTLLRDHEELRQGRAWKLHAESEFWAFEFNCLLAKMRQGVILTDPRQKH